MFLWVSWQPRSLDLFLFSWANGNTRQRKTLCWLLAWTRSIACLPSFHLVWVLMEIPWTVSCISINTTLQHNTTVCPATTLFGYGNRTNTEFIKHGKLQKYIYKKIGKQIIILILAWLNQVMHLGSVLTAIPVLCHVDVFSLWFW